MAFAEGEDGVLVFLRISPVVAQALPAVGGLRQDVFGEALAVGEEAQAMAGRGFLVFFDAPAEAFFGQQAGDEGAPQGYILRGVLGFAVLHAVAARPGIGQEAGDFVAPLPGGDIRIIGEGGFADVDDGRFLKGAVVAATAE